jgi:hypothetical protein
VVQEEAVEQLAWVAVVVRELALEKGHYQC